MKNQTVNKQILQILILQILFKNKNKFTPIPLPVKHKSIMNKTQPCSNLQGSKGFVMVRISLSKKEVTTFEKVSPLCHLKKSLPIPFYFTEAKASTSFILKVS